MRIISFVLITVILVMSITGCRSEKKYATDTDSISYVFKITDSSESVTAEENSNSSTATESSTSTDNNTTEDKKKEESSKTNTSSVASNSETVVSKDETVSTPPAASENETVSSSQPVTNPEPQKATKDNANEIADLVVKYLNIYRNEQNVASAAYLPKLTEYAKLRSNQIISDFSHNTLDERAAATALSYGKYIDPALYGMNGDPYYTACAGEAIAKAGYSGTADYISSSFAKLIKNSKEHWCYIGAAEYQYIGVGITYESGMWYCDVAMTRENFG